MAGECGREEFEGAKMKIPIAKEVKVSRKARRAFARKIRRGKKR
jgi:hypothetical protein